MAAPEKPAASGERLPISGGRYDLLLGSPLGELSHPGANAYAVQMGRGSSNLYALIPNQNEYPRDELLANALNINSPASVKYVDHDIVYLPGPGRYRPVLIFERPAGQPLMTSMSDTITPITNELIFRQAVESMYDGLRDIYLAGLNHGRINTTNVFIREGGSGLLQLGECLSTQPGKNQHYAFETIERMMATPVGRGIPAAPDDIYAAGVTLLIMLIGRPPALSLPPDDLLAAKIEKGSMMALIAGMKLPSAFSEIFRGMLADDPNQRWDLDDISHWLGGRRMGSKAAAQQRKAQRLFEFGGKGHASARQLANAFAKDPEKAMGHIEDGSLDRWIRRSVGDDDLADSVAEAIQTAASSQRGGSATDRTVSRVCIAMDGLAPIHFREVAVLPNGIGPLLAYTMSSNQSPKTVADILSAQVITFWLNRQGAFTGEVSQLLQIFEGQRMLLERPQFGFGVERVLYELNPALPCLSPMLEKHYANTLKLLAIGLEEFATTLPPDEIKREPMDRHIAAFVLARHRRMNDRLFPLMAPNSDSGQRAIAILSVLAELQRKFHTEPMPALAEWIGRLLQPVIDRYNNRNMREKVQRDLKKLVRKGDLAGMMDLIDDGNARKQDEDGFVAARTEWLQWENYARELSSNSAARQAKMIYQGRQVTSFISIFISLAVMAITIFTTLM